MGHYAGEMDGSPGPNHREAKAETVKSLFQSPDGEIPEKSIFLTERGALGINVGGYVLCMSIEQWHRLACKGFGPEFPPAPAQ